MLEAVPDQCTRSLGRIRTLVWKGIRFGLVCGIGPALLRCRTTCFSMPRVTHRLLQRIGTVKCLRFRCHACSQAMRRVGPSVSGAAQMSMWVELHDPAWEASMRQCRPVDEFKRQYTRGAKLGRGSFGKVFWCEKSKRDASESPTVFAAKVCEVKDASDLELLVVEYHVHGTVTGHPNVAGMMEVFFSEKCVVFMLDLGLKDLRAHVHYYCWVANEEMVRWMCNLSQGLKHIHAHDVLHRDLKPCNCILFSESGQALSLKISDFGASVILRPAEADAASTTTTVTRPLTPHRTSFRYASPEILHNSPYGFPSDIWSAGIILHEMMQCDPREPALACSSEEPEDYIAPLKLLISEVEKQRVRAKPGQAIHLVCQLLQVDPCLRPKAESLVLDPWLATGHHLRDQGIQPSVSGLDGVQPSASGLGGPQPQAAMAVLDSAAPEIWRALSEASHILEALRPSDICHFISSIPKLGRHSGNLLLHYILALAKYPFAVDFLATAFSSLPESFKAADLTQACHRAIQQCVDVNGDAQVQMQMVNFDEGRMASTMGLPRIMEWLQALRRDDNGKLKLGHGKPLLGYTLCGNTRRLRLIMRAWEAGPTTEFPKVWR